MVVNRPQWFASHSSMSQTLSGLHLKPRFQNSQCHSKPVVVICIYLTRMPLQILKSFQVPFNPFSNSCLSKIRMKIWVEEPYIGELHAVPTKFRNKLLSFHYLKKPIAQNNEKEINLIQRAYILT